MSEGSREDGAREDRRNGEPDVHEPTRPEEILGRRPDPRRSAPLWLLGLAVFYTLYLARAVFLPIVLAIILAFVLDPLVRVLGRLRIPRPVGAMAVVGALLAALVWGLVGLSGPAVRWIEEAPRSFQELDEKLAAIREPVEGVERATEDLQRIATLGNDQEATPEVRVREPSLVATALDQLRRSLAEILATLVLMGFLLSSGDLFLRKLVRALPTLSAKKRVVRIARHLRTEISAYLLTMGLINVGLGAAIATAMWLLGMPNPVLWGVLGGMLNFIPYLGPLVGLVTVGLVAVLSFDTLGQAAIPPLVYFALNTLEGSLVTPALLGRRLSLNPTAVLIALMLWGWMWGLPGVLMAVPIVVTTKIVCDHYQPLAIVGDFLGGA